MKAKSLLLTLFLSVAAVSLWAQDRYEYATLSSYGLTLKEVNIYISKPGSYEYLKAPVGEGGPGVNTTAVLAELDKLSALGWEVFEVTESSSGVRTYYLRKKKN